MKKLVVSKSCYQTTQEAWWWWGNSRDLCQNCALYVLCVSLEALAWLVAYLQVAILLTLQSYHLETGRRFLSIYTLPDYKVPLQLPSWGVSQSLDRNEVWLRSQHFTVRAENAVNQHFNKWYKMLAMAESEKLHKQGPIHWLSPISSSSGYLGHYHPSACFVVSVLFLGRYWWYPEVVCVSCSNIIISNIPGIIRATQNIVRNFPPSAATLLSPHVCFATLLFVCKLFLVN